MAAAGNQSPLLAEDPLQPSFLERMLLIEQFEVSATAAHRTPWLPASTGLWVRLPSAYAKVPVPREHRFGRVPRARAAPEAFRASDAADVAPAEPRFDCELLQMAWLLRRQ